MMTQPGAGRSRAAALRGPADRAATAETTRKLTGAHIEPLSGPARRGICHCRR